MIYLIIIVLLILFFLMKSTWIVDYLRKKVFESKVVTFSLIKGQAHISKQI